ncbi:MAG TPA: heme-binding protein [Clostridia bacterium]|nr:heme-binding protein [Clostridia bacterium]
MPLVEQIDYDVLLKEEAMEIRQYDGFNVAEIKKAGKDVMDSGFNDIFRYISGGNESSEKISMTSPVLSEMEDDFVKTSFVMPKSHKFEDLPEPIDKAVEIRHVPKGTYGAIRFTGSWKQEKFLNMSGHLRLWLESKEYEIISNVIVARYNPPFTPPFLRRNEILYEVRKIENQ